ncbi:MAG: phosphoribosylanthranilate isomerase [Lysobacteraceae bacterium]
MNWQSRTPHTRIKLCGMTRSEDVLLASALEVDAIGLIFAARSQRRIDLEHAIVLRDAAASSLHVVALMMDNPFDEVAAVVSRLHPHLLQFHGNEDDAFCAQFGIPFLKALPMRDVAADAVPAMLARYPSASGFVFDGHVAGAMGGSGERFDWGQVGSLAIGKPWLLAGGLDAHNVAQAIGSVHPWGVDVSSGIESSAGIKDHEKMHAFVKAVRRAENEIHDHDSRKPNEQR